MRHWLRLLICAVLPISAASAGVRNGAEYQVFYRFSGAEDGKGPRGLLAIDNAGNVYGATPGDAGGSSNRQGNVFRISPQGTLVWSRLFAGSDGSVPYSGVKAESDNLLYGTTYTGGASGGGTAYRLNPDNQALTTLYSFPINGEQGTFPQDELVRDGAGTLYGTTYSGPFLSNGQSVQGRGTVFRLDSGGAFSTLHRFSGSDGDQPYAGLLLVDGALYGTTLIGGDANVGVVYRIANNGTFSVLHHFSDGADGGNPQGTLVLGSDGRIYGTTSSGGDGSGTIFRITPQGDLTTLHAFDGDDGAVPVGLLLASNGNFYGVAGLGGTASSGDFGGAGTVFRYSPQSGVTVLYEFDGGDNGGYPISRLSEGTDGWLYGTANQGGPNGAGVIFRLRDRTAGTATPTPGPTAQPSATAAPTAAPTGGSGGGAMPLLGLLMLVVLGVPRRAVPRSIHS